MSGEILGTAISRRCRHCLVGFDEHVEGSGHVKCLYGPTFFETLNCARCKRMIFTHHDVFQLTDKSLVCVSCIKNPWTLISEGKQ